MFSLSHGIPLDVSTLETNENRSPVFPCVSRFFFSGSPKSSKSEIGNPPFFAYNILPSGYLTMEHGHV